jgi:hypothetical protein
MKRRITLPALVLAALAAAVAFFFKADPSHLPLGSSFDGLAYAYTASSVFINPALRIEDGNFDLRTAPLKYIQARRHPLYF